MNRNDELMHYGTPGMKWGVRKMHVRGDLETAGNKNATDDDYKKVTDLYQLSKEHDLSRLSNLNKAFEDAKAKVASNNTKAARDRIQSILDSEKDNKTGVREKSSSAGNSSSGGGGGTSASVAERQRNINLREAGKTMIADTTNNDEKKKKLRHGYSGEYLAHHGIEGQKWGVRRYQYEDGTLTPEGRKRYGLSEKQARKLDRLGSEAARLERQSKRLAKGAEDIRKKGTESEFFKRAMKDQAVANAINIGEMYLLDFFDDNNDTKRYAAGVYLDQARYSLNGGAPMANEYQRNADAASRKAAKIVNKYIKTLDRMIAKNDKAKKKERK